MEKRRFFDYSSITPLDKRVSSVMRKAEANLWGNPSSLHTEGEKAKQSLEESRISIAKILHCKSSEVFFTSGGTESLNLAIFGVVEASKKKGINLPHIITSAIEHPAILEPLRYLVRSGLVEVSFVSPNEKGIVSPDSFKKEHKENTVLAIVGHANNEIGTIQQVRKIKEAIGKNCLLLVDASQSVLYEDVSVERLDADILVFDGIKMYGPRGAGILVVKKGVEILPVIFGGGQEAALRPGTQNVPAALGLAKSLEIASKTREEESKRLKQLRDEAIVKILKEIPKASLNGSWENRLPNNINICFPGQDSEFLVIKLDTLGFAVSAASACKTLSLENSSYVIESVAGKKCSSSSLRITLGRETKKSDLDALVKILKKIIH